MAKKASNYKSSATEFGKRLTALYKLKIFPRLGREFAEKLFKSGIEAGAGISALSSIADAENKVRVATDAIVKLNETAFAAQMMVQGGFYTYDQTAPLTVYIDKLIEALNKLISSVKVRQAGGDKTRRTSTRHRVVVEQKPVVKRRVIVRSAEDIPNDAPIAAPNPEVKAEDKPEFAHSGDITDPDGFNAIYKK